MPLAYSHRSTPSNWVTIVSTTITAMFVPKKRIRRFMMVGWAVGAAKGFAASERDVVLEVVELAAGGLGPGRARRAARRTSLGGLALRDAGAAAAHALARAQHLHGVGHDLGGVLVGA